MRKIWTALAIATLALGLSACSATGGESVDPGFPTSTGAPVEPGKTDGEGGEPSPSDGSGNGVEREVIEVASVSLSVFNLKEASAEIESRVGAAGGFVESWLQQTNGAGDLWQVYATVRVPASGLDKFLENLDALGTVDSLDRSAGDVTTQLIDLDARIVALESSVERLLQLIESASSTSDLLEAESYLTQRQAELASLESQRDYLRDAVQFSTVSLSMYQQGATAGDEPQTFWEGVVAGWNGLLAFLGGSLVVVGLIAPWLLLALPVSGLLWFGVRKLRKKR